ncbi:MAG: hypothetical protein WCA64_06770, partial [Gallionella sp.]
ALEDRHDEYRGKQENCDLFEQMHVVHQESGVVGKRIGVQSTDRGAVSECRALFQTQELTLRQ